jgi:hypothetical protein
MRNEAASGEIAISAKPVTNNMTLARQIYLKASFSGNILCRLWLIHGRTTSESRTWRPAFTEMR